MESCKIRKNQKQESATTFGENKGVKVFTFLACLQITSYGGSLGPS